MVRILIYGISIMSYIIALVISFKRSKWEVMYKTIGTSSILILYILYIKNPNVVHIHYVVGLSLLTIGDFLLVLNKHLNRTKRQIITIVGTSMFLVAYTLYIISIMFFIREYNTINLSMHILFVIMSINITVLHRITLRVDDVTKKLVGLYSVVLTLMLALGSYCIYANYELIGWGLIFLSLSIHITAQQWWGKSISEYKFRTIATSTYVIGQILLSVGILGVSFI